MSTDEAKAVEIVAFPNDAEKALEIVALPNDAEKAILEANRNGIEITIFKESTHQYLIYFGHTKNGAGLLIGLVCIVIQWIVLTIILMEVLEILNQDRISVEVVYGSDCTQDISQLQFICDSDVMKSEVVGALGYGLLGIYLMGDVIDAIQAFRVVSGICSKIGSLIVIVSALYAAVVGSLFAFEGVWNGSGYNAIINCIGVLFVMDIDEQIFKALERVILEDNRCFCCECRDAFCKVMSLVLCLGMFIGVGFSMQFVWLLELLE